MTPVSHSRTDGAFTRSASFVCAVLAAAMLTAGIVTAWAAVHFRGSEALIPALLASVICAVGAFCALGIVIAFAGSPLSANAGLAGMLFRMGLPLAGFALLPEAFPELKNGGFAQSMLANYFVALIAETLLAVHYLSGRGVVVHGTSAAKLEAK